MRLIRVRDGGREHPGMLVRRNGADVRLDLGEVADDFDDDFWRRLASGELAKADAAALPELPADAALTAPLPRPPKIICIGLNYRDHAVETGAEVPSEPIVFMKAPYTVVGPQDDVMIPPDSEKTDWEVELGVVIGATARYLADVGAARTHVAGYVLSNDISERAFQLERGGQWDKGKSCETFNPLGPWVLTADEVSDPQRIGLWLDVNGRRRQDGSTADMIFSVDYLVWYLSQFMVLEPGDLINTGTPAGVALGTDGHYLRPGDIMTVGGVGLGWQSARCVAADPAGRLARAGSR